jgi:hypothetical protein
MILQQKHSLEAVIDISSGFVNKSLSDDRLVDYKICDSKTGKLLWRKESPKGSKYVDLYVCSDQGTKELTENIKYKYNEIISGFVVPQNIDFVVIQQFYGIRDDMWVHLNILGVDYPGQVADMKAIFLQKCDKSTVDKVAKYVLKKKNRRTKLAEKFFYDKKTKRYIQVVGSRDTSVDILFCSKYYSELLSK